MAARKILSFTIATLFVMFSLLINHEAEARRLENLAALALILRANSGKKIGFGGLSGIGGARYVPIPIYIKKKEHKKKKKEKVKYIFVHEDPIMHHEFDDWLWASEFFDFGHEWWNDEALTWL